MASYRSAVRHPRAASALAFAALTLTSPSFAAAQSAAPNEASSPASPGINTAGAAAAGLQSPQTGTTRRDPSLGVLRVVVLDESGAAILGSQVIARNASGVEQTAITNERGEAILENLPPGKFSLSIDSAGFEPLEIAEQNVRRGQTSKEVTLKIAGFVEQLDVTRDKTDEKIADTFSQGLSKEEIDQLPDDPDEMQAVLEQMAGPGASMFVNGFSGGRLPPKSQIQNIRFRFDPYSADNHDAGRPRVDIMTRPGNGEWRNNMTFTFRDESLNARYAMGGADKLSEQSRRGFWSFEGPLVKGKTSFALSVGGFDSFDTETISAKLPSGDLLDSVQQPSNRMNVDGRIEHALNKNHTLRIMFERNTNDNANLGVGQFDLPERAFERDSENTEFRISESGLFGRFRNELRVEYQDTRTTTSSLSMEQTYNVQGSFRSGGQQLSGWSRAKEFEISDDLDFAVGKQHSMRVGARIEGGRYQDYELSNLAGTYTYRSLDDFLAQRPAQFSIRQVDDPLVAYTNVTTGIYITDDYKLRKNIMLSAGVRYETQSILNDWNNLAPRVSMTYSPFKSNRTTLRAGFGVFYDWYETGNYSRTLQLDGQRQSDLIFQDPPYPFVDNGAGFRPLASIVREGADLKMPTVRRWSIGADHQLVSWLRLRTNYFEQRGSNELRALNANYPDPVSHLRPDPNVANITEYQSIGKSQSRGVDLGLNLMLPQRRIFAFMNYTLAKSENDGNGTQLSPTNTLATEWGYSPQDVRHRLFGMLNLPLPFGFRTQTMFRYQTGVRYNITTGNDDNGDGIFNERPDGLGRNTAVGDDQFAMDLRLGWTFSFGPPRTPVGPGGGGPQIRVAGPGGGGGGRGGGGGGGMMMMGGGPGGDNKRYSFEIFAQANNVLNSTLYTSYAGVLSQQDRFGVPVAALPPRRIELGTRFGF